MNVVRTFEKMQDGFIVKKCCNLEIKQLKCSHYDKGPQFKENGLASEGEPYFTCRFSSLRGDIVALANEVGDILILNTSQSNKLLKVCDVINLVDGEIIFDLAWMPGEMKLVTTSSSYRIILWDVEQSALVPSVKFRGHRGGIKAITFMNDSKNVFATGGRDGAIFIWDIRMSQHSSYVIDPDNAIISGHSETGCHNIRVPKKAFSHSITGLACQDDHSLISASAGDGLIKVWDTRRSYSALKGIPIPRNIIKYPGHSAMKGFTSLNLAPGGMRLYASCMDSTIYCFNTATYESKPVSSYCGHECLTFFVKSSLSSDGQYLVSGSSDGKAYIWRTGSRAYNKPLAHLVGHEAEVSAVDWGRGAEMKIMTCSDDTSFRLWRVTPDLDISSHNSDQPYNGRAEMLEQPLKSTSYFHKCQAFKERHLNNPNTSSVEVSSPTLDLPNYAVDGLSPRHRCSATSTQQKENRNWLTDLCPSKSPTISSPPSQLPKRRISRSLQRPGAKSTLFKFFKPIQGNQNAGTHDADEPPMS